MRQKWARLILWVYTLIILIYLLLPSLYIIGISLDSSGLGLISSNLTFKWYARLFTNQYLGDAAKRSFTVGIATMASTVVIGLLAARAYRFLRRKSLFIVFMVLPIFVPGIVVGFNLIVYFKFLEISGGLLAIWLAHMLWVLPFIFVYLLTTLSSLDPNLLDAARDLGSNEWQAFRYVELPLISNGVIGASVLAFTLSLNEFIRTFFVQGINMTLTTYIFGFIRTGTEPTIFAMSGLITLLSLVTLALAAALAFTSQKRMSI
jgi:spermidine/putrescine transport system permease protein